MISYLRQMVISESVLKTVRQAFSQSGDAEVRHKAADIPTKESVLRAVTLYPSIDTEEKLKGFIIEHVLDDLRLTAAQKERLNLNG